MKSITKRIGLVLVALVLAAALSAEDTGYLGLFGALGYNTYELGWTSGGSTVSREPLVGGFAWAVGIDGYMDSVKVNLGLYFLNPGLSYLAAMGEWDLTELSGGYRGGEHPYFGAGFGMGMLTRWDDDGVDNATFAFNISASAGLLSVETGSLWVQSGFIFAYTSLGESGGYSENEWFLLVGFALGLPWSEFD